ncbi:unnamed protein product [Arabidopsis lyrata]|uniref:PGG domain-containing protein n=1 Tax=Arabidopsis lyrata subsp. lyrata TaxID=81972 RepID=D7MG71_ARALL|nr:ankyrin repeat-containing protein At5g02620 [Arabidopsis lyrata subsp. lyrata]EFH46219.1 hypothetical protein ARALYDRAFT_354764 [Arabidopsis lyrata subsp. lyrata]CAH8276001.1 unnamed protein product [Arabidopsis lyrata]|eukprot:XP_002869960.1 ankyrin repeat-containing protein At5g02620 [Arabidopsis lyrata subsp. lyrata]
MANMEGSSNQCEAATIQPENVILDIGETSGSSPNVEGVLSRDDNTAEILARSGQLSQEDDRRLSKHPLRFYLCEEAKQEARRREKLDRGVQLYQATLKGDWNAAKTRIDEQEDIVRQEINSNSEIALHIAVAAKHEEFVRNLIEKMHPDDLRMENKDNNTPLHFAAASGVVKIAEMLIEKDDNLPNLRGPREITPIHAAALFGRGEMVMYLYERTRIEDLSDTNLIDLFIAIISADIYDVALKMLQDMAHKDLAISRNRDRETALHLMARKPTSISYRSQLNWFQKSAISIFKGSFPKAKMGTLAHQLVDELWKSVLQHPMEIVMDLLRSPSKLLFDAAELGNVEFLVILIRSYPDLIWKVDNKCRSLFHIAALYRHESIFKIIYELGGIKDHLTSYIEDESKNNLLHFVARLPPPNRLHVVSGAALQMQRELLWFKAVKEIVPRSYIKTKNKDGQVAHDLFTKEHENLRKEGEKWMKETATACMLVAALIATVVFAATFTLPGGTDTGLPGFPQFRGELWFTIFILSDSAALFSSVIAIVLFLSILTSRYAEDDFRTKLPTKLMLGLFALFISINTMVLAFTASMILIRRVDEPVWRLILIVCLSSLAAITFALLHVKLWFITLRSAYFSKFLFRKCKSVLFL